MMMTTTLYIPPIPHILIYYCSTPIPSSVLPTLPQSRCATTIGQHRPIQFPAPRADRWCQGTPILCHSVPFHTVPHCSGTCYDRRKDSRWVSNVYYSAWIDYT